MKREYSFRNMTFFFVLMIVVWTLLSLGSEVFEKKLSRTEFESLLNSGAVKQVVIHQNRETPTGEAQLVYQENAAAQGREHYYVSDVNRLQEDLKEKGIDFLLDNVQEKREWMNYLLPTLIAVGAAVTVSYTHLRAHET